MDRDPRFEWIHVPEVGNEDQWVKGSCNHLAPVPVHAEVTGELVAHLCPDCDAQLPAELSSVRGGLVNGPQPFALYPGEEYIPLSRPPRS
ncbi:hypothetical protein HY68_36830 [Streptomyces sp. AcH 505]|uniref:hypothetical protein n=1 Tax=Streptomyces sp. AcH 505 TaxID=352211 RepID=UPI000591BCB2|nr:hypothetical protein HY68_36830 [Streptomyces sp. AcH 505]